MVIQSCVTWQGRANTALIHPNISVLYILEGSLWESLYYTDFTDYLPVTGEAWLEGGRWYRVSSLAPPSHPPCPLPLSWATGLHRLSGELSCPPSRAQWGGPWHTEIGNSKCKGRKRKVRDLCLRLAASFSPEAPLAFPLSLQFQHPGAAMLKCHYPGSGVPLFLYLSWSHTFCK